MRILFILHYPPPVHGPAIIGSYIKESKTINTSYECSYLNLGISQSIEEIGRRGLRKLSRYLSLIREVRKQISVFCPDLIYLTPNSKGAGFYKDAFIIFFAKRSGKKVIYHFHNKGVSLRQDRFFDNLLYRFVFRNVDVILLSKLLYPDVQKYVPENRVHYCPNGIPEMKGERRKEKRESDNSAAKILFLSNLIRSKGVLVLIEACKILVERNINFHCTIAGGEAELTIRDVQKITTEKGLNSLISITGEVNGNEKMKLMSSADIFVHPSFNDCLPLVLLEAMQYSLPVVSTFEGAIPDVVEDRVTGFLVPHKDAVALTDKLEILLKETEMRSKMGRAGRVRYEQKFILDKFEERLKEILEEVGSSNSLGII